MLDDARVVLDLGCGNGPLLDAVARARPQVARLVGVDACAADLALALARLPAGRADLRCERAQALSLADASIDAALSHHAFYLFDPLEPAVAEVARVLRPGGLFACVTWSFAADRFEPFAAIMTAMAAATARDRPAFRGWCDRRNFDRAELEALLVAGGFAAPLEVEEHALVIEEPAEALADRLLRFFYSVDLQREETRAELRAAWLRLLAPTQGAAGNARLLFPFALTRICKAGPRRVEGGAGG